MVALALSWGSVELLFALGKTPSQGDRAIISASLQP
jgi:hypothetical protein